MSLRLILMRHAKSSWKSDAADDHQRPLNGRGRREAPRMAAHLVDRGWRPDLILSSDAARTRETLARMAPAWAPEPEARFSRALYLGGVDEVRAAVAGAPSSAATLLLLGHNPGWEDALAWLSGAQRDLKTASAALLECDAEGWAQVVAEPGRARLLEVVRARELE